MNSSVILLSIFVGIGVEFLAFALEFNGAPYIYLLLPVIILLVFAIWLGSVALSKWWIIAIGFSLPSSLLFAAIFLPNHIDEIVEVFLLSFSGSWIGS